MASYAKDEFYGDLLDYKMDRVGKRIRIAMVRKVESGRTGSMYFIIRCRGIFCMKKRSKKRRTLFGRPYFLNY